jgi:hypothetical protein
MMEEEAAETSLKEQLRVLDASLDAEEALEEAELVRSVLRTGHEPLHNTKMMDNSLHNNNSNTSGIRANIPSDPAKLQLRTLLLSKRRAVNRQRRDVIRRDHRSLINNRINELKQSLHSSNANGDAKEMARLASELTHQSQQLHSLEEAQLERRLHEEEDKQQTRDTQLEEQLDQLLSSDGVLTEEFLSVYHNAFASLSATLSSRLCKCI